jgi:hypothetical protein
METKKNANRIFMGKSEGKTPLGGPRRRWVDNVKMDLREIEWAGMDWIDLAQDTDQWRALVNMVMNLPVPYSAGRFFNGCTTGSFSRRAQLHEFSYTSNPLYVFMALCVISDAE